MSTTPAHATVHPSVASGRERLEKVQADLRSIRGRIDRGNAITIVVGLILLGLLGVYFYIGYRETQIFENPSALVDLGEQKLDEYYPKIRDQAVTYVKEQAPAWASKAAEQGLQMVPQARPRIEQFLLDQMDETLKKANLMSEDQFRKFINERRPLMEKTFQELASNQKLSESSMDEIFKAMELEMGGSMQDEAINLLGTIKNTNAYWKDLSAGNDLTDEAKLERRVLQLARLLVNEATDPNKVRTAVKTYTPERRTLGAVVKSVDAGNHSLTLSVPPYKKGSVKTYKLNNDLKIHTVAGKEVSLADLKEGTRVIVTLGSDDQTVKGITARGRLDEAAPPPAKLKLTPRTGTTKTPAPAATKTQKKENSK